jgi:hypothetical protein
MKTSSLELTVVLYTCGDYPIDFSNKEKDPLPPPSPNSTTAAGPVAPSQSTNQHTMHCRNDMVCTPTCDDGRLALQLVAASWTNTTLTRPRLVTETKHPKLPKLSFKVIQQH